MTKQQLATKIWNTANALRKNIKASEYKDYILGFMFYKYISEKEVDYVKSLGGDIEDIKDADEDVITKIRDAIGYFIPYEDLFETWKESGIIFGAKDVSEALESFEINLNPDYKPVFDGIFGTLQSGLSKLGENAGSRDKAVRDIVDAVSDIPPKSVEYDVLGYIYEYLIQQFSSEAKKDGAFYTPHELTGLMARVVVERLKNRKDMSVYDPCLGTGGLLLNIGKEAGKYMDENNVRYYGQELITETMNLAKMNLFMQDVPIQNICVRNANTLEDDWPYFDEQTPYAPLFVDASVCNPPYSAHWNPEAYGTDERFKKYGLAPEGKADLAFLLHCLYHIKQDGVMAIVLPHGVLFRGDSEGAIRKNLVDNHNIETVIGFPAQLFFATGIPVIVMILSKNRPSGDILFIDASQNYRKGKKQNVLSESDVKRIYDAVINRQDVPGFARLVQMDEIIANDYNLNIPRYVSAKKEETPYDLYSVMFGKVSDAELEQFRDFWNMFPALKGKLFTKDGPYNTFADTDIKKTVFEDVDVVSFRKAFDGISNTFRTYLTDKLLDEKTDKYVFEEITEEIFRLYGPAALVEKYDVYQAFADNWMEIEADLGNIRAHGFDVCKEIEPNMVTKKKDKKTYDVQEGWKGKVMPFDLIKSVYYAEDFKKINDLTYDMASAVSEYEDIFENLEEDVKAEIVKENDDTAFDAKKLKAAIKDKRFDEDILESLKNMQAAIDKEKDLKKKIKTVNTDLEDKAKAKVEKLKDSEVRDLLIMKWIDPVIQAINGVAEDTIKQFAADLTSLKDKYAYPMSDIDEEIQDTSKDLDSLLSELTGGEHDMLGIAELRKMLEVRQDDKQ